MLIVSYYTKNTGYEEEIKNLIASCKKFNLGWDIVGIESRGRWDANCCYKPRFLLEKLKEHQTPLVWMDADAVFLKKPTLFQTLTCDMALRIAPDLPEDHPSKMITGTLFLQNRPPVFEIMKLWDSECTQMLKGEVEVWDQIALKQALSKGPSLKISPLPDPYYMIYDQPYFQKQKAVIAHYQASRLLKKEVNQEVVQFWERGMFSQKNRRFFSDSI